MLNRSTTATLNAHALAVEQRMEQVAARVIRVMLSLLAFSIPLEMANEMLFGVELYGMATLLKPFRFLQIVLYLYSIFHFGVLYVFTRRFSALLFGIIGVGLAVFAVRSLFVTYSDMLAQLWGALFALSVTTFLIVSSVPLSAKDLRWIYFSFALGMLCNVAYILTAPEAMWVGGRASGLFENPNALGFAGSLFLVAMIRAYLPKGSYTWLLLLSYIGLALFVVNATQSRSALLVFAVQVAMIVAYRVRSLLSLMVILLGLAYGYQRFGQDVMQLGAIQRQQSKNERNDVEERVALTKGALDAFTETYFIGLGIGQFQHIDNFSHFVGTYDVDLAASRRVRGAGLVTHNTWTQLMAEYGLVGLLLFVAFLLSALLRFRELHRIYSIKAAVGSYELVLIVGMLMYASTHVIFFTPLFWVFFALLLNPGQTALLHPGRVMRRQVAPLSPMRRAAYA